MLTRVLAASVVLAGTGCSLDGLLNSDKLPPDASDPALTQTPDGARQAYYGALAQFGRAFAARSVSGGDGEDWAAFVPQTGLLSDELTFSPSIASTNAGRDTDQRALPERQRGRSSTTYSALQKMRGQTAQAIGLLADFLPDQPALRAHLYALQAYSEIFLAEFFCSGVPLGTLDYRGDFTYAPSSTTDQVLTHSLALFDTALVLAEDSVRFIELARVGRGRALLGLGDYAGAAVTVAPVPDGYTYEVRYQTVTGAPTTGNAVTFFRARNYDTSAVKWSFAVPDREGTNGLDWRTSNDPRTPISATGYPTRYDPFALGGNPVMLASGLEARLIQAEAALQSGSGAWLTILNALRTDGTFDTTATSPPDTLWHAGTGGVAGLAPLADPDPSAPAGPTGPRVDLLFRERAFWLFLTGHRQGDLRRLIWQYNRVESDIYPVGTYLISPDAGVLIYQSDVTAPIPTTEFVNPLYTGCLSRGA